MLDGKRILGLIPARGGSKRVPGKNIRSLGGRALIEWTIDAASNCLYLDDILVSTDDKAIASVARDAGLTVPFLRSPGTSTDRAKSIDVAEEVVDQLKQSGAHFDILVLLQPTSPLRLSGDIDAALELFQSKSAEAVISICECEHSPLWAKPLTDELIMDNFMGGDAAASRSQDLQTHYRPNGAIFATNLATLLSGRSFYPTEKAFGYLMPQERSIDIDTELDFKFAEFLLQENH
ncbi:MAG: CMP-N,N'-diacetyllegionaminic acid synthase [Parasphingorhabdus sp.]